MEVGKRPRDIAFTPDGQAAYVSGEFDASLYRMAVPEGEPVERVLQLRKEARPMAVVLDAATQSPVFEYRSRRHGGGHRHHRRNRS